MRRTLIRLTLFFLSVITLERCANPTAITGGAKDTIPPNLILTNPPAQSTDVSNQEFSFEFDESINADKLSQELLITPTTDLKFTHTIKKNTVTVKFEESFADSTTYTFNFREGITDATERNPVLNFKYAFSTGSYIDSLQIAGTITSLLKDEPQKDFLVGLYVITDTLSPTQIKPYYFYNTDNNGTYQIDNIKPGKYLLFSFKDNNNNLLFNPKDEPFAIYQDTININSTSTLDSLDIKSVSINADQLTRISARPSGNIFSIRYSKPINIQSIAIDEYQSTIPAVPQLSSDKTEIQFYKQPDLLFNEEDSVRIIVSVTDTLNVISTDTVYLQFLETNRTPKEMSISASNLRLNRDTLLINIKSSKPIFDINTKSVQVRIDTLLTYTSHSTIFEETTPFTGSYSIRIPFKPDSIYSLANQRLPDSMAISPLTQLDVNLGTDAVLGIENDTLTKQLSISVIEEKEEDTGIINITIATEQPSFKLTLINKSNKIVRTANNKTSITFKDLKPDAYRIEVYIDANNNGRWDVANPWKNTASEPIYIYPNTTELKSNWIVDIEDINF